MGRATRLGKLKYAVLVVLALATVAVVALAMLGKTAPVESSGAMDKAQAYSKEVRKEIDDANAAYAASLLANVKKPVDRPLRFMVPGDSLAGGYYSSTEANGFRALVGARLAQIVPTQELKASQAGANLATVGGLVGIPKNLDLAIVELGTNDTAGKTELGAFTTQYATLLRTIKEGSPDVALICVGPWGAPGAGTDPYDMAVETACKAQGGQFVKISTVFALGENRAKKGTPSWLGPADDFHPNDAGHKRIADLILERIKIV